MRGEGTRLGQGLGEELVPLHRGGAAEVFRSVPAVHPDQFVVSIPWHSGRPEVPAVACKCASVQRVAHQYL